MSLRSFLSRLKLKSIKLGPVQFEVSKPESGSSTEVHRLDGPVLSKELIRSMNPNDLKFQELELIVSDVWNQFIDLVNSEHANFKIDRIIEDENTESSFGCSGSPGVLTWPIRIVGTVEGTKITHMYDLISSFLLPLAKSMGPSDGSIPWDNSLFEASGNIGDRKTHLRNATYWVLFVNI